MLKKVLSRRNAHRANEREKPGSSSIGQRAEDAALAYLRSQGLRLVERNFHCKCGEIDLIMQHADCLVFVEVRYRKKDTFGGAIESITTAKQHKIVTTAQYYLQKCGKTNTVPCRFDVVAISPDHKLATTPLSKHQCRLDGFRIQWISRAFET